MIYQLMTAEKALFDKLKPCHYTRRIKSHFLSYGACYDFCRFFAVSRREEEEPDGLISCFNSTMIISDMGGVTFDDDEIDELAKFILMNRPCSVEIDPIYSERIAPLLAEAYEPDLRTEFAFCPRGELPDLDIDETPSLDDVFAILRESFPTLAQSYELWITDTSHRVRRGLSQSFLMKDDSGTANCSTATIQYILDRKALIGHVATLPEYRGQFYARRLLYWIGERLTNDGFEVRLFARPHRVSYYEEIGFAAIKHDKVFELKDEFRCGR
ncbi:MAG: GNAT family N-acetyltransferase [Ruminococcus sp.]|nr:GNAT family N-acetyltransferase [Ruminococcus sp.]